MFCEEMSHEHIVAVNFMNEPSKRDNAPSSPRSCESCANTFRSQVMLNMLICVPHLKIMSAKSPACDLYATRNQKT
jgi:hypothetical protein